MKIPSAQDDPRLRLLDEETRANLERAVSFVDYAQGDPIQSQGTRAPNSIARIESGEVEILFSTGRDELALGSLFPGEWISWFSLYPDNTLPFSFIALSEVRARVYPSDMIRAAMRSNGEFASAVAGAIADYLERLRQRLLVEDRMSEIERVETFPFRKRVFEVMQVPPIHSLRKSASALEVARMMTEKKITSVIITDESNRAAGIVTEQDITRAFESSSLDGARAEAIMSRKLTRIDPDAYLYQAIGLMMRSNIRHLPVIENDEAVGILTMRSLMKLRSHEMLSLVSRIEDETDPTRLGAIREAAIPIYRALLDESTPALEIAALISHINQEIHRRAIKDAIEIVGAPPVDFCLFVTGSHGRGENHLMTDQDHGMILAPYSDSDRAGIEAYYVELTEKFSEILAGAGLPYCAGNVMSLAPVWRKTFDEWRHHVRLMVAKADRIQTRYMTLLADIEPIYGADSLAHELKGFFIDRIKRDRGAALALYEEASEHKAPLGLFNRIITERNALGEETLDLKKSALIFVVEALRTLAVVNNIKESSTLDRLRALVKRSAINSEDSEFIASSFKVLFRFLLRSQLAQLAAGRPPDTSLRIKDLSLKDRDTLKDALRSVKRLQSILQSTFGASFY